MKTTMSKLTILITGATGFLGSALLKSLIGQFEVIAIVRSTSKLDRIEEVLQKIKCYNIDEIPLNVIFEENKIDLIVHCATNYGRGKPFLTEIVQANLILPLHLLQLASLYKIKGFVNTDTILDNRINLYSLSKKQFLEWLRHFSQDFICINVALEHFYGPFDNSSKFVTWSIRNLLDKVQSIDLTEGKQKRDFIYIDDVVQAFLRIIDFTLKTSHGFWEFEVGSDERVEIRHFVELAKELSENSETLLNFGALPYRENEVMESRANTESLRNLGWQPTISLKTGLLKTIESEKKGL